MLWFWRSLYRIISLLMQVCRKENTHFLSFFQIFSLISHIYRTPIVWKLLSQMPWGIESRPQRVRQDYWHEEIFEERRNALKKKNLSFFVLRFVWWEKDRSKSPLPLQALAGPHVVALWPRDTYGHSALLSASPKSHPSSPACSQDAAGEWSDQSLHSYRGWLREAHVSEGITRKNSGFLLVKGNGRLRSQRCWSHWSHHAT